MFYSTGIPVSILILKKGWKPDDVLFVDAAGHFEKGKRQTQSADEHIWLVSFMDHDLGCFDDETCRLEPLPSPFGPKVLPMSSV